MLSVLFRHVFRLSAIPAFLVQPLMTGDPFTLVKALNRILGEAHRELLFGQLVRHGVIMALYCHMVVNVYPDLFPLSVLITLCR